MQQRQNIIQLPGDYTIIISAIQRYKIKSDGKE